MENGTVPFFIIFKKNLTFQRCPKALVLSKGINEGIFASLKKRPMKTQVVHTQKKCDKVFVSIKRCMTDQQF